MYRFLIFSTFCLGLISLNTLYAQDSCKCDYIASGYYQLVYEAEIAHLEENDSLAYEKLQEAEKTCTLLNQLLSREIELYGMLLLKNKDFGKAIRYMEKLATEYGGMPGYILSPLEKDSVLASNLLAEYPAFNDSILPAILQKRNDFYTPERKQLIAELTDISNSDQAIRADWKTKSKGADSAAYFAKLNETDSLNAERFFEIVEKQGFPNRKRYGSDPRNIQVHGGIHALLMHFYDFGIEEIILQFVRDGECEPDVFGSIIDKGVLEGKWKKKSLYATWSNGGDDQIIDVLHVDERRIAIGMPTREMAKRRTELIDKRWGEGKK
jgi:hypothetical protein